MRDKALSRVVGIAGELSRRVAHRAVVEGRVAVNGTTIRRPETRVSREATITLDGTSLDQHAAESTTPRMWLHNKPRGLITTHSDTHGRPTVFGSLPSSLPRVLSVGRLDLETEGLLLLTTSGSIARRMEHPSSRFVREYHALVVTGRERGITTDMFERLHDGLVLQGSGFRYEPIRAELLRGVPGTHIDGRRAAEADEDEGRGEVHWGRGPRRKHAPAGSEWVRMRLVEGKNREVRRCWAEFGFTVGRLIRVAFGPFRLPADLQPGELRECDPEELRSLDDDQPARAAGRRLGV
jgi:23S rRNA pseudouridine2605 synthase